MTAFRLILLLIAAALLAAVGAITAAIAAYEDCK